MTPLDKWRSEPVERLLAALDAHGCHPRRSGAGWTARCPSHEDRRPSLSVAEGDDGRALVRCFAGCPTEAVVSALGLRMSDLMPNDNGRWNQNLKNPKKSEGFGSDSSDSGNGQVFQTAEQAIASLESRLGLLAARWNYHDATGELVGVTCRWDTAQGKEIRPVSRHPDGWRIAAMPAPRPLYNLRALLAAPLDKPVIVTEGERCADAATACGLLAVTSAGGASAAHLTDWGPLRGRKLVVLPDNDEAGERYAEDVARLALAAGAAEVRVLRLRDFAPSLPAGGDLADILADDQWCGLPLGDAAEPEDLAHWILTTAERIEPWKPEPAAEPIVWQSYPTNTLPQPFRQFVEATAQAMGCDASYVGLPLIAAAAAAIGTTRMLELKRGWRAPSILWGAIVGESGSLKTPALWTALQWMERWQDEFFEAWKVLRDQYQQDVLAYEKALSDWKRSQSNAPPPAKPEPPVATRVLVQDTTIEALAPILKANPRGVLLARDELAGWLAGFDRYANTQGAEVAHWLSMYNAKGIIVDRKTSGTLHIPTAAVSIIGGIQPNVLRRALGLANRENGLAARLLLVMPPPRPKRWTAAHVEPAVTESVGRVFVKLFALEHDVSEDGRPAARVMHLSPDALAAYVDFYNAHATELADATGDWASALSKLEELPARLALVFHLVRWAAGEPVNPDVVDAHSMGQAIALTQWHKHETRRVYDALDANEAEAEQRRLVEWIERRGGAVTVRDVTHGIRRFRGKPDEAEAALNGLVEAGLGAWGDHPVSNRGGRPTHVFRLCHRVTCHQNFKKALECEGFGDGDIGDTPDATPTEPTSSNPMPPVGGDEWDALFDEVNRAQ